MTAVAFTHCHTLWARHGHGSHHPHHVGPAHSHPFAEAGEPCGSDRGRHKWDRQGLPIQGQLRTTRPSAPLEKGPRGLVLSAAEHRAVSSVSAPYQPPATGACPHQASSWCVWTCGRLFGHCVVRVVAGILGRPRGAGLATRRVQGFKPDGARGHLYSFLETSIPSPSPAPIHSTA